MTTVWISALLSLNLQEMGQGHRKWFHWRGEPCPLGPRGRRERAGIREVSSLVGGVKGGEMQRR